MVKLLKSFLLSSALVINSCGLNDSSSPNIELTKTNKPESSNTEAIPNYRDAKLEFVGFNFITDNKVLLSIDNIEISLELLKFKPIPEMIVELVSLEESMKKLNDSIPKKISWGVDGKKLMTIGLVKINETLYLRAESRIIKILAEENDSKLSSGKTFYRITDVTEKIELNKVMEIFEKNNPSGGVSIS